MSTKDQPTSKKKKPFYQHYDLVGVPLYIGDTVILAKNWGHEAGQRFHPKLQLGRVISTAIKTVRVKPVSKKGKIVYAYSNSVVKFINQPETTYCGAEFCKTALDAYWDISRSTEYTRFYINHSMQSLSFICLYGPDDYAAQAFELLRNIRTKMPEYERKWEQDKIMEILNGNHPEAN